MTEKQRIGSEIKALRQEQGISTYALQKQGIHTTLTSKIEKGVKGYTIDNLLKYLEANNLKLIVQKKTQK